MAGRDPFGCAALFRAFNPEELASVFEPYRSFRLETERAGPLDMAGLIDANRRNFEALMAANSAATAAYGELLAKQLDLFGAVTQAACDQATRLEEAMGPEALGRRSDAFGNAMEANAEILRRFAEDACRSGKPTTDALHENSERDVWSDKDPHG